VVVVVLVEINKLKAYLSTIRHDNRKREERNENEFKFKKWKISLQYLLLYI